MKAYGHIYFMQGGEKGAMQQNCIMRDMNDLGIISVSEDWINEQFELDRKDPVGCDHHYLLHNLREIRAFRKMLKGPKYAISMPDILWKITLRESDGEFKKWLKRKDAESCEQGN